MGTVTKFFSCLCHSLKLANVSFRIEKEMNDENMEEVRVLEAQIEHLMAEVAALQDQQQDNQKDLTLQLTGQIHNAM